MREMKTINDFKIGQIVRLIPTTQHGKNRINQHGELWKVKMLAKNGKFISLNSLDNTWKTHNGQLTNDWRRVDINNDTNFKIVEV